MRTRSLLVPALSVGLLNMCTAWAQFMLTDTQTTTAFTGVAIEGPTLVQTPGNTLDFGVRYDGSVTLGTDGAPVNEGDYTVTFATVDVTVVGDGIENPPYTGDLYTVSLGPVSTTVTVVGNTGTSTLGPVWSVESLALVGGPYTEGTYQFSWSMSAVTITSAGGKAANLTDQTHNIMVVPEPSEYAMLAGMGLLGLCVWRARRK